MPRPDLTSHVTPAPLTIAAVAERLGVATSTLRTWERRYGIGPSKREPGKRRRYGPEEVEMLEAVVRLVRSGVSPSDAAKSVQQSTDLICERDSIITVDQLVALARTAKFDELQRNLDILISREGLLRTWNEYIGPAMRRTHYPPGGDMPGFAPRSMITQATLSVIYEVAEQADSHAKGMPAACRTLIVCDDARELHAHVVGVSLQWEGVDARVLPVIAPSSDPTVSEHDIIDVIKTYREDLDAHTVVLLGSLASDVAVVNGVDDNKSDLVLVCRNRCSEAAPGAIRIRTLSACVEESIELARNCSVPGCKLG